MNRKTSKLPAAELCIGRAGELLRVRFGWWQDRLEHRLEICAERSAPPGELVLQSCEAGDQAEWPYSPALQQLDTCQLSAGRSGLVAVGMAGTSHWSLAVECREDQLAFDVACRVNQPPRRLMSSYMAPKAVNTLLRGNTMALAVGLATATAPAQAAPDRCERVIELTADNATSTLAWYDAERRVEVSPLRLPDQFPATVRWGYRLMWMSDRLILPKG